MLIAEMLMELHQILLLCLQNSLWSLISCSTVIL